MIRAVAFVAALALCVLLGVIGERWRVRRQKRELPPPKSHAYTKAPPGARDIAANVAASIDHVLKGDARRASLSRYVGDVAIEAYCRGADDFRAAVVHAGPLPPEVMDGVCNAALSALDGGARPHVPPEWPAWALEAPP